MEPHEHIEYYCELSQALKILRQLRDQVMHSGRSLQQSNNNNVLRADYKQIEKMHYQDETYLETRISKSDDTCALPFRRFLCFV